MYNTILFPSVHFGTVVFLAFPLRNLTPTVPCSYMRKKLSAHTHTHTHSHRCFHITPSHIQTHCEPWLSSADNKSEEWPLAASLCLTLSLCNPSSLPLLIYTCFSSHSSTPLFPSPADFFVCTLFFANLFSCFSSIHPSSFFLSSLFSFCCVVSPLVLSGFCPTCCFLSSSLFTCYSSCCRHHHSSSVLSFLPSFTFISCRLLQDPLLAVCLPPPIKLNESKLELITLLHWQAWKMTSCYKGKFHLCNKKPRHSADMSKGINTN